MIHGFVAVRSAALAMAGCSRPAVLSIVLLVLAPAVRVASFAEDDTGYSRRYFSGLRERRLFSLAEFHCLDQLARDDLSPVRRAELTLELSRTYAEHARFAAREERDELWRQAERTVADALHSGDRIVRRPLLQAQWASVPAARADFMRWQLEIEPFDARLRRQAVDTAREAIRRLQDAEVALVAINRSSTPRDDDQLTAWELRQVLYVVRFRLGLARLTRAVLPGTDGADRAGAVIDAEESFRRLAGDKTNDDIALRSRVYLAECRRLRGDVGKAAALLERLSAVEQPRAVRDLAFACRSRLLMSEHRFPDVLRMLNEYQDQRGSLPGELHFLRIQTIGAQLEHALSVGGTDDVQTLRGQMQTLANRAVRSTGGYWSARCVQLVELADQSIRYGPDVASSVREASAAWQRRDIDTAVTAFGRAVAAAQNQTRSEIAAELLYTRGSILVEVERFESAAADFGDLVSRYPNDKHAADAHLLAAFCLGRQFAHSPSSQRRAAYAAALTAHRTRFKKTPTAIEATWMLAQLEDQSRHTVDALRLYLQIPETHSHAHAVHAAVARCYERILDQLRESNQPESKILAWEADAARRLNSIIERYVPGQSDLDAHQADVLCRTSRLLLNQSGPDYDRADRLLRAVIENRSDAESPEVQQRLAELKNHALGLRIVSLAGRRQYADAEATLGEIARGSVDQLLAVLDGLAEISEDADESTRLGLGKLLLRTTRALGMRRSELSAARRAKLDLCVARAYEVTGQNERAVVIYTSLIDGSPQDRSLWAALAHVQERIGTDEALSQAGAAWQRVESFEKPGTPEWLLARYHLAKCALRRGDVETSRKLLTVTRLLHPDLGGPQLRQKFDGLDRELDRKSTE